METVEDLKRKVNFTIKFETEDIKNTDDKCYYSFITAHGLAELLIELIILERRKDFLKWLPIVQNFLNSYDPKRDPYRGEHTALCIEYYKYLVSLMDGKPENNLIKKYALGLDNFINKEFHLNKNTLKEFEELVHVLVMADEYDKAKIYCQNILKLEQKGLISLIYRYLSGEQIDDNFISDYKSILNKRKHILADIKTDGFIYYRLFFCNILKDNSVEPVIKSMFFGI